ncbi:hypothetical protein BZG10_05125, partial [Salinivibrio kushneri]
KLTSSVYFYSIFCLDMLAERLPCVPCRWRRIIEKLLTLARLKSDFFRKKSPFGQTINVMA